MLFTSESCPCGTGKEYDSCCGAFHRGLAKPKTAEQLMRSRYSAYAKTQVEYVLLTTHPQMRKHHSAEAVRTWCTTSQWKKLEIVSNKRGQERDNDGEVEFIAHYSMHGVDRTHRERSSFKKVDGVWFFYDAENS